MGQEANNTELIRRIENLLRPGTIEQVDAARYRVRVRCGDLLSNWIRWFQSRAGDARTWSTPSAGEQCLLICPGGDMASAVVLVGFYSDEITPPENSASVHAAHYPDGAFIRYDHQAHALTVELPEGGTADITVPDSITVRCKTADVTASDSATVHSQKITLDAPMTIATGQLMVQGLLTYAAGLMGTGVGPGGQSAEIRGTVRVVEGDVIAEGISLVGHTHGEVSQGDDSTGKPE